MQPCHLQGHNTSLSKPVLSQVAGKLQDIGLGRRVVPAQHTRTGKKAREWVMSLLTYSQVVSGKRADGVDTLFVVGTEMNSQDPEEDRKRCAYS